MLLSLSKLLRVNGIKLNDKKSLIRCYGSISRTSRIITCTNTNLTKSRIKSPSKLYSLRTSSTTINRELLSDELEEHEDDVFDKERHLKRVQKNLLPFLDVAVNSNLINLAFKTLQLYHSNYQGYGIPLNDIRFYNYVLQGFATEGNWDKLQEVLKMISKSETVKPNLQTFVFAIECAYRGEKFDAISGILDEIKLNGFDIYNIFLECNFYRDQRIIVLKAIRTKIPDFEPNKRNIAEIDCKLLENLKGIIQLDKSYNLASHLSANYLKDLITKQLELESKGLIRMSRIDYTSKPSLEKTELMKKLEEHQIQWKEDMLQKFQVELNMLRMKSNNNNGEIDLFPYLSFMEPTEFVDLMFEEFLNLNQNSDSYSIEISMLRKLLGLKVMDKYFHGYKIKNGILQQVIKLYMDYCDYLANPELISRYSPRQYWLLLKEKYSEGPDIESNERKWPTPVCSEVGRLLYDIMTKSIKLDLNYLQSKNRSSKKKLESLFRTTLRIENEIKVCDVRSKHEYKHLCNLLMNGSNTLYSSNVPMLCPPIPWNSYSSGGFLLSHKFSQTCFLRTANLNCQENLRQADIATLFTLFDSVNHISACPWMVNKKILNIILEVYKSWIISESGFSVDKESVRKTNEFELAKLLFRRKRAIEDNRAKNDLFHKLSIANEYRDKTFWFPHNIDFRGRVYPIPSHFHYQLSDVDRGLLLFAKGEPLGKNGLDWLKIQLLNLSGYKKSCSLEEKIDFCNENLSEITDSADNPLKGNGWWQKCSNPWQTLACCIELTSALRSPNHCDYISHLPVHQDGFCNGLQHYAALGRDRKIAEKVNMESANLPEDLYTTIADLVEQQRRKDVEAGNQVAMFLEGLINRKFVKQPLIVMIYGSSLDSAYSPILQQLKEISNTSYEQQIMAAEYLVEKMWPIFNQEFSSVLKIQNWFTECGSLILQIHDQPVKWISPLGLPIVQPFIPSGVTKWIKKNRFYSERETTTKESNIRKHAKSFSSNFIHSLDASHLLLTSLFCQRQGITFVGVHDSFWTHANNIPEMNKICREQFIALHNEPLLENLSKHLQQQFCDANNNFQDELMRLEQLLNEIPSKGTFDLKNILNSPYFFS